MTSATEPLTHSLAELDRILGLRRGQSAYLHRRGIFQAEPGNGRVNVVKDADLPDIAESIRQYVQAPNGLSVEAAAHRLGIRITTVYTLIAKGRLLRSPGSSRRRGQLRITLASIEEYAATRRRGDSHDGTQP